MITLTKKEWTPIYRAWKAKHPNTTKAWRAKFVRGCLGKAGYETMQEAVRVRAELPRRGGLYVNIYFCRVCEHLHIGNSRKKSRDAQPEVSSK